SQALVLAVLTLSGHIQVWHILALASVYGIAMGFDTPVRQSLLIGLVGDKQDLANAIALNSMLMNTSRMIGPSIAGVLLALLSEGWCFLINAASYLAILLAVHAFHITPGAPNRVGLRQGLREAARYAWRSRIVRTLLPLLALMSFMASPYVTLMPVIAHDVLHGRPHTLAVLVGAAGLGALAGTSWLAVRGRVSGLPRVISVSAAIAGLALIFVSRSTASWLSLP